MKKVLISFVFGFIALLSSASNLGISNVSLTGQNPVQDYIMVQFDVSWEHSWRLSYGPSHWDAVWIFVKFRALTDEWRHAVLNPASGNHLVPGNCDIEVPGSGTGVFLYRNAAGTVPVNFTVIQWRWDYAFNGWPDDADIEISVMGIEMVYIPQNAFYAGDNNTSFASLIQGSSDNDPWHIVSEASLQVSNIASNGYYYQSTGKGGEFPTGSSFQINEFYPKGFKAFYIMKYEISQEQYRDFLNCLDRNQQQQRVAANISGTTPGNIYVMSNYYLVLNRSYICCSSTLPATGRITFYCDADGDQVYDEPGDGQNVAMNYLTWMDLAAYADWSGLRPMTELEYEKACRGTRPAVSGEYVWGNTALHSTPYSILFSSQAQEIITNIGLNTGNALYAGTLGPGVLRTGIFSYSASNSRQETGATYYGLAEMAGNVSEFVVNCGTPAGLTFSGLHGNGILNDAGDADVDYWPGINGNNDQGSPSAAYGGSVGVTQNAGAGFRGGSLNTTAHKLRISDRSDSCYASFAPVRTSSYGGRLVLDAPGN